MLRSRCWLNRTRRVSGYSYTSDAIVIWLQQYACGSRFGQAVARCLDGWILRKIRPDIIHVHNYEAPMVAVLGKVLSRDLRGVPIVYSAHNTMGEELSTYFEGAYQTWMSAIWLWHWIKQYQDWQIKHWYCVPSIPILGATWVSERIVCFTWDIPR